MTGTSEQPAYEQLRQVWPFASVLLQRNPGVMTLEGTNTWVLRAGNDTVVVDPGQHDGVDDGGVQHLDALLAAAPDVSLVLVSHGHGDHSGLAAGLHERTGAPVRALDPQFCHAAQPLADDEPIALGDVELTVLATPGHTADSVCLLITDSDGTRLAVLTGDTILGRGTTVVAHPDGNLGAYLASLRRLARLGGRSAVPVLAGHGPELPDVAAVAEEYLDHREQRLEQVRSALRRLGPDAGARQIVEDVYADVDPAVWFAAEWSVAAQLAYLRDRPAASGTS